MLQISLPGNFLWAIYRLPPIFLEPELNYLPNLVRQQIRAPRLHWWTSMCKPLKCLGTEGVPDVIDATTRIVTIKAIPMKLSPPASESAAFSASLQKTSAVDNLCHIGLYLPRQATVNCYTLFVDTSSKQRPAVDKLRYYPYESPTQLSDQLLPLFSEHVAPNISFTKLYHEPFSFSNQRGPALALSSLRREQIGRVSSVRAVAPTSRLPSISFTLTSLLSMQSMSATGQNRRPLGLF
jgi:hypothetical protein